MKNTFAVLMLAFPLLAHAEDKEREFYVALGGFSPASNAQLANPSGQFGFVLGGGGRFSPHFSWNVDLLFADARVDTPQGFAPPGFPISQSGRAHLETWGLGGILKAHLPLGIFDFHAGGGVGFYKSTLTVERNVVPLLGTDQDTKRSDQGLGLQWIAGVDARMGERWRLGFQWRRLDFKAQLGAEVPGEVNTGGNFGLLYSRWVF